MRRHALRRAHLPRRDVDRPRPIGRGRLELDDRDRRGGEDQQELREPDPPACVACTGLVEAIGWEEQRVMLERLERPLSVGWEE